MTLRLTSLTTLSIAFSIDGCWRLVADHPPGSHRSLACLPGVSAGIPRVRTRFDDYFGKSGNLETSLVDGEQATDIASFRALAPLFLQSPDSPTFHLNPAMHREVY